ncbi:hypothetical protein FOA52_009213, partial [Chlamydomonas sp. UWO 241]
FALVDTASGAAVGPGGSLCPGGIYSVTVGLPSRAEAVLVSSAGTIDGDGYGCTNRYMQISAVSSLTSTLTLGCSPGAQLVLGSTHATISIPAATFTPTGRRLLTDAATAAVSLLPAGAPLLLYSANGTEGSDAAAAIARLLPSDAVLLNLEGGIAAWGATGLPLVEGLSPGLSIAPAVMFRALVHLNDTTGNSSVLVIDVRTEQEYNASHIGGAVHILAAHNVTYGLAFDAWVAGLPSGTVLLFVGDSGDDSLVVAQATEARLPNTTVIVNLERGMAAWSVMGFDTVLLIDTVPVPSQPTHCLCTSSHCLCINSHCLCTSSHCLCTSSHCLCTNSHCLCTSSHCLCTNSHCLCTSSHCLCINSHCLCTSSHCLCTSSHCLCTSSHCLCTSSHCLCTSSHCLCTSSHCLCTNSHCLCTSSHCLCINSHCLCTSSHCLCTSSHCLCTSSHCLCTSSHCLCTNNHCLCTNNHCLCTSSHCLCTSTLRRRVCSRRRFRWPAPVPASRHS